MLYIQETLRYKMITEKRKTLWGSESVFLTIHLRFVIVLPKSFSASIMYKKEEEQGLIGGPAAYLGPWAS